MFKKTSLIFFIITLLTGCAKNVSSPIHLQDEKHKHSTPSIKKIILPIPTAKVDSSQIIFSPDYKKVAAIIHPLNTNKIPRIMIWNPVNGSLLHSTALSKNEAKAHNFGSMRFSSNSQTLVYTQRGNDWSFIWNFTKQKKPIFCQMGSEILDINTQLVLVKPTDGVIGLYDLNNCKVIALAFNNILGSKDVVIGADNKMLWKTTQYLPKKLKDAWLYHKLPAFRMYHSKIFKNKTDLVELPTVLRHKNTSGSMAPDRIFFNTSKKKSPT